MGILSDFFRAFIRVIRSWRLWLIVWGLNLVTGTLAASGVFFPLLARLGFSTAAVDQPLLSPERLLAVGRVMGTSGGSALGPVLLTFGGVLLLQPLLAGGIWSALLSGAKIRLSGFVSECVRLFGRNVRLLFFTLPVLLLALGLVVGSAVVLSKGHHLTLFTIESDVWLADDPFTRASVGHLVGTVLVLTAWRAYLDLARGVLVQQELRRTRVAAWRALKIWIRSPLLVLAYAVWGALGLAAVVALMRVRASLPTNTLAQMAAAFGMAQVVVLARAAASLLPTALVASRLLRAPPAIPLARPTSAPPPPPPRVTPVEPSFDGTGPS